ncbi:hypothetical protein OIO90_001967 [Microbotryomycetes sp. JL221]|nr:hypothetical protein OIO90_001967 [Microbotryomycetes sp. JL221]
MSDVDTQSGTGRYTGRKVGGSFVARSELNAQQQAVLAAVPVSQSRELHWKRQWVRPAVLKPGQQPNFKVLKWVLATDDPTDDNNDDGMNGVIVIEDDEDDSTDNAELSANASPHAATTNATSQATTTTGPTLLSGQLAPTDEQVAVALAVAAETGQAPAVGSDVMTADSTGANTTAEATPSAAGTPAPTTTAMESATDSTALPAQPSAAASPVAPVSTNETVAKKTDDAAAEASTGIAETASLTLPTAVEPPPPITTAEEVTMQDVKADEPVTSPAEPKSIENLDSISGPALADVLEQAAQPLDSVPVEGVLPVDAYKTSTSPKAATEGVTENFEAVKELRQVDNPERLVGTGDSVDVVMGEAKEFVEDEVQVAQEATQGMVGMTEPELKEGQA